MYYNRNRTKAKQELRRHNIKQILILIYLIESGAIIYSTFYILWIRASLIVYVIVLLFWVFVLHKDEPMPYLEIEQEYEAYEELKEKVREHIIKYWWERCEPMMSRDEKPECCICDAWRWFDTTFSTIWYDDEEDV